MYITWSGNGFAKKVEFENKEDAQNYADKKNKTLKYKLEVHEVEKIDENSYKFK